MGKLAKHNTNPCFLFYVSSRKAYAYFLQRVCSLSKSLRPRSCSTQRQLLQPTDKVETVLIPTSEQHNTTPSCPPRYNPVALYGYDTASRRQRRSAKVYDQQQTSLISGATIEETIIGTGKQAPVHAARTPPTCMSAKIVILAAKRALFNVAARQTSRWKTAHRCGQTV